MRLAIQLYTLRTIDAVAAFPTLAAQGYEAVELFERPDDADELRRRLEDAGLEACGWHVGLERLEGELGRRRRPGARARDRGTSSSRGRSGRPTGQARRRWRGVSPALRDRVVAEGFSLGYHNHGHELEPLADGTVVLDVLAEVEGLELELDLGWAWAAGADPVTLLAAHAGRVPLVHAKDFGVGETSTPVGDGLVGFERIVPAARDAGVEWLVAEQEEHAGDPLEATARSAEFLRRLL